MNLFSKVESGTIFLKSRFHKSISYSKRYDCRFGEIIPVLEKFVLPGDVWRIGGDALVRFHPMLTPTLTKNTFKVRYFFVPLRLVEPNTELIITGSKDGHLSESALPVMDNIFKYATDSVQKQISKYSFYDYLGCQVGDYKNFSNAACLPALYWYKAYARILWDYYWDENLQTQRQEHAKFEDFISNAQKYVGTVGCHFVDLKKDYFISSLPWQLKGTAPAIQLDTTATFTPDFNIPFTNYKETSEEFNHVPLEMSYTEPTPGVVHYDGLSAPQATTDERTAGLQDDFNSMFETEQSININGLSFTADDLRTMMAQTRIFERLARTGSRYTEYLRANFFTSPADGTLQRAQYLGGWSMPIVTTEVLQTAADGSTPVGTMRGHGISRGGNRIRTFFAKEFGVILGLAHVIPETEYTTGIPREFSYKSRFDFFNPSFQHLSEQEVRNGELYFDNINGDNDETFGFQAYGNELRTTPNRTVGALRDDLSYWTQSLHFNERPNLNNAFLQSSNHLASFNAPFAVNGTSARPVIVDVYNDLDVYRPMVRYSTPGLVDHL